MGLTEEQIEIFKKQVEDGNNVKAVMNSKGWKETCLPLIMALREDLIKCGRVGYDYNSKQFYPSDPNIPAKAMWSLNGVDEVLTLLARTEALGADAKRILSNPDTAE